MQSIFKNLVDAINHYRAVWPCANLDNCYLGDDGYFKCCNDEPGDNYSFVCILSEFDLAINKMGEVE